MNIFNNKKIFGYSFIELCGIAIEFIKFSMVGVFNTVLNYLLYSTQLYLGVHYFIANAVAWGIGVFVSYLLNSKFVFSTAPSRSAAIKTYIVYGISFSVTSLGLFLLIDLLSVSAYIAPIIMLLFSIPFNFLAMKYWAISKKTKKLVVFDLDGTLFATDSGISSSIESVLVYNGLGKPDEDLCSRLVDGVPSAILLKEKYILTEARLRKIVKEYRNHYQQFGIYECTPYPCIEQLLIKLKRKGFKLAVASLKNEDTLIELLENKGVAGYFDTIIGNDSECTLSKESVLKTAIKKVGFTAKDSYLVGDSYYDYDAARVVGCEFIGVTYGYGFCEEEITRLSDVIFVDDVKGIEGQLLT